ncbi:acylneuraminate cytidylyltransferase [Anaerosporobacter faecicola]|uniref:acylneuraminate cytidylyltransferase n=1 Tax=Anaerosporobacter faecicola TaxID=2718714 RepID=UPI00143C9BC3|nr:acylneuraminate cytidylyltransferase [Anaerosporobacter faecicola]
MNILAIIPARSGSKSVPHKNIRMINNKPMLAYSIEHALQSELINRVIVSTDSEEYAEIARQYGAETPFIRPAEYAQDHSLDIDVFYHCLAYLKETEGYEADLVVQLRPTYPIRNPKDIDTMIEMLQKQEDADSVRSIALATEIPYKMWKKRENGEIVPVTTDIPECYNMPRQELPVAYYQNACIDVVRGRVILEQRSMSGKKILGYEMKDNYDIDTEEEMRLAQNQLKICEGGKRFVFDIDGVIAKLEPNNNYRLSEPNTPMIEVVNKLYEMGNQIILFTARGYVTGVDWKETTQNQLSSWGVHYHELHFGKPNADYYVDDKFIDMNLLLKMVLNK